MTSDNSNIKTVRLLKGRDYRVRKGGLWVFSNEISNDLKEYSPGDIVHVERSNGVYLGTGYINPHSLIAVRLLSHGKDKFNEDFFHVRIHAAAEKRRVLPDNRSVCRLVYSEGDFLPGLIMDRYNDYIVIHSTTAGMDRFIPVITGVVQDLIKPKAVLFRNDRAVHEDENHVSRKDVLDGVYSGPVDVELHGMTIRVDLLTGQKTGLYLDQIDNYEYLRNISNEKTVLDCCCYTGGFSIHALHYGAVKATGIDVSKEALVTARINADLNNFSDRCEFVAGSIFDELRGLVSGNEKFDIIILDPPSFTRSKAMLKQALKGYHELNLQAVRLLRKGGYLLTFSCSHHVSWEDFILTASNAAKDAKRMLQIIHRFSQAPDHPVLLSMPETEYFKGLVLQSM